MRKACLQCGKPFEAARKDAKYCSDSCKVMYNQKAKAKRQEAEARRAIEKAETGYRDEKISEQIRVIEKANRELLDKVEQSQERLKALASSLPLSRDLLAKASAKIRELQKELRKNPWDIYNERFNVKFLENPQSYDAKYHFVTQEKYYDGFWRRKGEVDELVNPYLDKVRDELKYLKELEAKINRQIEMEKVEQASIPAQQERWMQIIRNNDLRLRELDKLRFATLPKATEAQVPPKPSQGPRKALLSAQEVMSGDFDGFALPGPIGEFMGNLERYRQAIAITGEPGAGKSYLSFELAKAFVDVGLRVKYYSLEEGIGRLTKEKLAKYKLESVPADFFLLSEEGTMSEIKKDAKEKVADVLIVDSFGKLKGSVSDLDQLRQAFPATIFVFIFQQTTKGGTKGGAAIEFDCTMRIVCTKDDEGQRVAIMRKSRYGTQDWQYYPMDQRVVEV